MTFPCLKMISDFLGSLTRPSVGDAWEQAFDKLPRWFPGKASAYIVGDLGSIPGSGRSPGEGNGNPLQYSCLENLMDAGAWWATVHGITKSQT